MINKEEDKKLNVYVRTALDLYGAVLRIERIVVQIHHAGQCRCKSHAISDRTVAGKSDEFVAFSYVVQKARKRKNEREKWL